MNKEITYFPRSLLAGCALLVAHLVVAGTQDKPSLQLFGQLNYWLAMAFSFPFTYLLMWWIHFANRQLDRYLPWQLQWSKRILYQFVLCVVLVLLVDLLAVRIYFWSFGADFSKSGYMQVEFHIICWMVMFMNAAYIARYFSLNYFHGLKVNHRLNEYLRSISSAAQRQQLKIDAKLGNKIVRLHLSEIACFERHENIGHIHLLNGKIYHTDLTMPVLVDMLGEHGFYQINRSVLLSLQVVRGYEKVKNVQTKVLLDERVSLMVSLLISRTRLEGFKQALDNLAQN